MRIAIIGAGFSGLLAAYILKKKGIRATVFEREDRLGGHCMTISKSGYNWELGTVFSYSSQIKELLIDLGVSYKERNIYKHFVDEHNQRSEHLSHREVTQLLKELEILKGIFTEYTECLEMPGYGFIHKDLLVSFDEFIRSRNIPTFGKFIKPFLSSFSLGNTDSIQVYYVLKLFSLKIINAYLQGDKILFFENGTKEIIEKLSNDISDIRFSHAVTGIALEEGRVLVETSLGREQFDKVLVTVRLSNGVIRNEPHRTEMEKIRTNPFISCAFEVRDCDAITTYFKGNLALEGKIQLFRVSSRQKRKILVAYCNGYLSRNVIEGIKKEIQELGIAVDHLITARQWEVFPHLSQVDLTSDFYLDIQKRQRESPISLIGSLVSVPSLDKLYNSISRAINEII